MTNIFKPILDDLDSMQNNMKSINESKSSITLNADLIKKDLVQFNEKYSADLPENFTEEDLNNFVSNFLKPFVVNSILDGSNPIDNAILELGKYAE